jgi:hypothetical protein
MKDFHCTSWSLALNSALSVKNSMTDIRKKQCELTIASKMEKDFSSRVYDLLVTHIGVKEGDIPVLSSLQPIYYSPREKHKI